MPLLFFLHLIWFDLECSTKPNKITLSRGKSSAEVNISLDALVDIDGSFPRVPALRRKLMNFLWIVDCISQGANAQLGLNDLSLLLRSMLLPLRRPILQIRVSMQRSPSLLPPRRCSFWVCLPLASCGWRAAPLILCLRWNLSRPVLTQFYSGPHCNEINWGSSFYFVSLWLLSILSFCAELSALSYCFDLCFSTKTHENLHVRLCLLKQSNS